MSHLLKGTPQLLAFQLQLYGFQCLWSPCGAALVSPQGGNLLMSHEGKVFADILEKGLVRQENVNLDCCPSPSSAPT